MYSVLIVEDEPLMRQYLLNNLSLIHPEFQVVNVARNGKEAVSVLEKTAFDLIITDIQMPGMDGLSFVKQLRDAGSSIPVIILTGYDEFEYARAGLRLGVAEYLLKPLNDSELCRVLEAIKGKIETINPSKLSQSDHYKLLLPKIKFFFLNLENILFQQGP